MWEDEKSIVFKAVQKMLADRLVIGSQGNASLRFRDANGVEMVAITPRGLNYDEMKAEDIVILNMKGRCTHSLREPSSEFRLHLGIYQHRKDVNAILHSHSLFASVLAVAGMDIPAILDEQVYYLGNKIKVSEYERPGTQKLAGSVIRALGKNNAVIMANHGALCVGGDMLQATNNIMLLERVSQILIHAKLLKKLNKVPTFIEKK